MPQPPRRGFPGALSPAAAALLALALLALQVLPAQQAVAVAAAEPCLHLPAALPLASPAPCRAARWSAGHDAGGQDEFVALAAARGGPLLAAGTGGPFLGRDVLAAAVDPASQRALWAILLDGPGEGRGTAVAASHDGTLALVAGARLGQRGEDAVLAALDARTGAVRWAAQHDGPLGSDDAASAVAAGPDVVVLAGEVVDAAGRGPALWGHDPATGALRWAVRLPGEGRAAQGALALAPGGGLAVVAANVDGDMLLAALDPATGALRWTARVDIAGGADEAVAVALDPAGLRVVLAGTAALPGGERALLVASFDAATGAERWLRLARGLRAQHDAALASSPDGALVVAAVATGLTQDATASLVVAYGADDGAPRWRSVVQLAGDAAATPRALAVDGQHALLAFEAWPLLPPLNPPQPLAPDVALVALDAELGTQAWVARHDGGARGWDSPAALVLHGGAAIVAGAVESPGRGTDATIIAFDAS